MALSRSKWADCSHSACTNIHLLVLQYPLPESRRRQNPPLLYCKTLCITCRAPPMSLNFFPFGHCSLRACILMRDPQDLPNPIGLPDASEPGLPWSHQGRSLQKCRKFFKQQGDSMANVKSARLILVLAILAMCLGVSAFAQFLSGIEGTVKDSSTALIAGPKATLTDTRLGIAKSFTTNQAFTRISRHTCPSQIWWRATSPATTRPSAQPLSSLRAVSKCTCVPASKLVVLRGEAVDCYVSFSRPHPLHRLSSFLPAGYSQVAEVGIRYTSSSRCRGLNAA